MKTAEKIEKLIKEFFKLKQSSVAISSQMDEKILDDALEAFEKSKMTQSADLQPSVWRIIMKSRITKFAVAAIIIIAVIIGIHRSGNFFESSAYAQVAKELRNARTVVFTLITQTNQGNGETVKTDVAYKEPSHIRTTTVDGYVAVVDGNSGKMISIVPGGGYTLAEMNSIGKTNAPGPIASIEAMKNLPAKADENLGTKEIDGIVCDGYRVTQGDLTITVWINAKTGDLVQVDQKYASAPGMNKIIKNIKFDVVLDNSLFSLTPPAGYKPFGSELKSDVSAETEKVFIDWLRWWVGANVDDTFPPMVAGSEIAKVVMDMGRQGKLKGSAWGSPEVGQQMFNAMLFVSKLPKDSNWRYMGENVKFGTSDKAIFWYMPKGSQNYRVIYGDLSVREVSPENLPK